MTKVNTLFLKNWKKLVGNDYDVVAAGLNGSNIVWRILIDKKGEAQAD